MRNNTQYLEIAELIIVELSRGTTHSIKLDGIKMKLSNCRPGDIDFVVRKLIVHGIIFEDHDSFIGLNYRNEDHSSKLALVFPLSPSLWFMMVKYIQKNKIIAGTIALIGAILVGLVIAYISYLLGWV